MTRVHADAEIVSADEVKVGPRHNSMPGATVSLGDGDLVLFMSVAAAQALRDGIDRQLAEPTNIRRLPMGKARIQAVNPGE
jgi:hypothetical protein